ncbi:zinc import ATP-binding protein ZnuC [Desulfuromonas versatilis]|uniref:Zinc import ATP-binding protein ZnuC n=1 Tax=Desulfuromonas versatilis TaxID=2802975 RepID=A0ABM8HQT5_9BACT|nr:zinc ABC transporter ATP-binding protein ZnuC [Desulfuromonas versatilis]BCR04224.1 zinc import ATP-binding protein ZnuC [Desulfuromonas versatilis]
MANNRSGHPGETLIALDNVSMSFQKRQILREVSLTVQPGEITTLIGPNGAGKTSLLQVALGLLTPDSGSVYRRPGLRIGYMPQRIQVDRTFPLTVRRFLGLAGKQAHQRVIDTLGEVGAGHTLETPIQGLSGGETQRVLLARALLRDPELLVLDEPVQGVDVHGQVELYQLITRLRSRRGCAVLMVSHDLHMVMASTDRVICLNRHICCTGTPEAVTRSAAYVELFGPLAVKNLAIYSHDKDHRHEI